MQPSSEKVTIHSDGIRLAGDFWAPPGGDPETPRPAILLVHGWGGSKDHLNRAYAPQFSEMGYYVLTFDYRGWGDSDGELRPVGALPDGRGDVFETQVREYRQIVDPIKQYDDIEAAIDWLMTQPGVDRSRLAVWGSSLGGGLALKTAVNHPEIDVLIIQIGNVNPQASIQKVPGDSPVAPRNIELLRSAIARGEAPAFPGPEAATKGLEGFVHYPGMLRHEPMVGIESLKAATLIIDAEDEELFDTDENGRLLYERIKDQTTVRYETLPGSHYELYVDEGYAAALELEKNWLEEHFKVE